MKTEWNYEPCIAERVTVIVADAPQFPAYWARKLIGHERFAVEITCNGQTFYIDDEDGSGWEKVINGGGPWLSHKSLEISNIVARMENC